MSRRILIAPEALLATPLVALVAALPPAVRLAGEGASLLEAWLAVAALVCPVFACAIVLARAARRSISRIAGEIPISWVVSSGIWMLASLPATAFAAVWLKAHTHHRGLAGATFAVMALGIYVATALVARRVSTVVLSRVARDSARHSLAIATALVVFFLLIAAAYAAMGGGVGSQPASASRISALLLDGAFALVGIALGAAIDLPPARSIDAQRLGAGATIFVVTVGLALAVRSPAITSKLNDLAPLADVTSQAIGLSDRQRSDAVHP
jgi:choline-sulfatase